MSYTASCDLYEFDGTRWSLILKLNRINWVLRDKYKIGLFLNEVKLQLVLFNLAELILKIDSYGEWSFLLSNLERNRIVLKLNEPIFESIYVNLETLSLNINNIGQHELKLLHLSCVLLKSD